MWASAIANYNKQVFVTSSNKEAVGVAKLVHKIASDYVITIYTKRKRNTRVTCLMENYRRLKWLLEIIQGVLKEQ